MTVSLLLDLRIAVEIFEDETIHIPMHAYIFCFARDAAVGIDD